MSRVGEIERITQNRVVKLFEEKLGYKYLGNLKDEENNRNVETRILRNYLREKKYSEKLIERALSKLSRAVTNQTNSLYDVNKEVYGYLRYGIEVRESVGENKQTVRLINWDDVYDNNFYIAEEVTIKGENTKRPDIVLYVNGIALGVLELKRSTVSVAEGIRQNLDNQESDFIKPFFHTIQLVMAGNDTEGLRYATIETPEKYYLTWKEDKRAQDPLSRICKYLALFCLQLKSFNQDRSKLSPSDVIVGLEGLIRVACDSPFFDQSYDISFCPMSPNVGKSSRYD
jgi:type I restriction enzyme R subunit